MPFELIKSETLLQGRAFKVRRDTLKTPNGGETKLDIVEHGGSVVLIPIDHEGNLQKLGEFYLVPGYSTERMAVFLATELKENPLQADDDEFLQVEKISLRQALNMAEQGGIQDAKSLAALLLARSHVEKYLV